jgi:type 1 glutamine amidotransferase
MVTAFRSDVAITQNEIRKWMKVESFSLLKFARLLHVVLICRNIRQTKAIRRLTSLQRSPVWNSIQNGGQISGFSVCNSQVIKMQLLSNSWWSAGLICVLLSILNPAADGQDVPSETDQPIKVLLITGGCCHDYEFQTKSMQKALEERGHKCEWKVVNAGGNGTDAQIELYKNANWAEGFDVVIHNECFADTKDADYIRSITEVHKAGVNAVVIHCAMHTYRSAKIDDWRELLGVTSRRHEHQSRYPVKNVAEDHPIMQGFPVDYVTQMDELYVVETIWPNTKVLATSTSEATGESHPVLWTNEYGKARVFGTTYGHSNETFAEKVFLDTLTRGILWSAGKLEGK